MLGLWIPIPIRLFRAELSEKIAGPDRFFADKAASAREGIIHAAFASHGG